METNQDILEHKIMELFRAVDTEKTGKILIGPAGDCLRECKFLSLTLFQINILLGLSNPDL
jgi:hypothetical protein